MVSEVVQPFWAALQDGELITGAAESVGSYRVQGQTVDGGGGRGSSWPWSRSAGPLFVVFGAGGDCAGSGSGGVGAVDRAAVGPLALDDLKRAGS
jgi:hypothetical protein